MASTIASRRYENALYKEPGMCPDGAYLLLFSDGTSKAGDLSQSSSMVWTDAHAQYNTHCPEIRQIECENKDPAQPPLAQALAGRQEPEERSRMVLSEPPEQDGWFLGHAPWKPFQKPAAPQAPKGGKPPRKKPAAATGTVHKLVLTPDLMSELRKDVDRDIAALKDKPGQLCMVVNDKLIARKQISKNIPSGSLLCLYGNSWHRAAGSRPKTRAFGPDRLARSFCMCTEHLKQKCVAITTA